MDYKPTIPQRQQFLAWCTGVQQCTAARNYCSGELMAL